MFFLLSSVLYDFLFSVYFDLASESEYILHTCDLMTEANRGLTLSDCA